MTGIEGLVEVDDLNESSTGIFGRASGLTLDSVWGGVIAGGGRGSPGMLERSV